MTPPKKRSELGEVFNLILNNFNKKEIQKKLNLKPSALSNHLRRLETLGAIQRRGKYIIKVLNPKIPSSLLHPKVTKNQVHINLNKRGHAFNFKIFFSNEINFLDNPQVKTEYKQKKLKLLKFGSFKLKRDNTTVWINKGSITAYSSNSYYSGNALHSKFRFLQDADTLAQYLKDRFNFKGIYGIEVFREHYGLIFNKFAQWLLKKGKKMYVRNEKNKAILWVDASRKDDINLKEFEGTNAIEINNADTFFNSHEKQNWKVDADFTLKAIGGLTQATAQNTKNLDSYAQHLSAHVESIKKLGAGVEELTKIVKELKGGKN